MAAGSQPLTFISYSRADSEFALDLAKELRSSGFNIWLDQLDIPTGCRWDDEVEKALLQCDIFMVILTHHSIASNNVKDEIGYAIDSNKRIIPILLQNSTVPFRLRRFQYVDFTGKSYEEGITAAKQLLTSQVHKLMAAGSESVQVGNQPTGVRMLPKGLVDQQRQPLPVFPINRVNQNSREANNQPSSAITASEERQSRNRARSRMVYVIPLSMGLILFSLICLFVGWLLSHQFPDRGGYNIISGTTLPMLRSTDTVIPFADPILEPTSPPAATARPADTATFTFSPESTFTLEPARTAIRSAQVNPVDFLIGYFNLVILDDDFSKGWSLLTPEYQTGKAESWKTYLDFWTKARDWSYSSIDVHYNSPPRACVLITYTIYYYGGTKPSSLTGVHYCLLQTDTPDAWMIDLRENCP